MPDASDTPKPGPPRRGDRIDRAFVGGTLWIGFGYALQALFRLALIAVLTKSLDKAHFGYWALVAATAEILAPLATFGITFGHTRMRAGLSERTQTYRQFLGAAAVVLLSGAAVSLLLAVGSAAFAAAFMGGSALGQRVVLAGAGLILFTSFEWCLRFHFSTELQMGRRALLGAGRFGLELAAAAGGVAAGLGVVEIVLLLLAARAVAQVVAFGGIVRGRGWTRPDFRQVLPAIRYGLPLQLGFTAGTLTRFSDRLVLGGLRETEEVGAYSAIYEICAAHLIVIIAIEAVLLPVLSALANRGLRQRARWMFLAALKYLLVAVIPIGMVISTAARPILLLVTRETYVARLTAEHHWITWGAVCYAVAMLARVLLAVGNRTLLAMGIMWGTVALKIALLFVLIQWWGTLGAAVATFAAFAALMLATLALTGRWIAHGPPTPGAVAAEPQEDVPPATAPFTAASLVLTVLAAAVAAVPLHLLAAPSIPRLVLALAAYGVTYLAALFAFRAIGISEIRTVLGLIRRRT